MSKSQREQTCCFTGHRDIPPESVNVLTDRLERTLRELIHGGVRYFGAGGALGFDTLAARTVLKLRQEYSHIRLILVLPCLSQTRGWRESDVQVYEDIKEAADKVTYTSKEYTRGCMHKRNRHLVDWSSTCICYLTKPSGGTAYTVGFARRNGLRVVNLAEQTSQR